MIKNYLKTAIYNLFGNKTCAIINISRIAIKAAITNPVKSLRTE
jgi:hypothetical protein